MPSNGLSLETHSRIFSVVKSPLFAGIPGGSVISRPNGTPVTLNGSPSRDYDVETGDHSSMQFTWLCKGKYDYFPYGLDISSMPIVTPESGPSHWRGCFNTGVGKLNSTNMITTLDTSKMTVGSSYDVKLVVTKDDREANYVQRINIVSGNPPEVVMK